MRTGILLFAACLLLCPSMVFGNGEGLFPESKSEGLFPMAIETVDSQILSRSLPIGPQPSLSQEFGLFLQSQCGPNGCPPQVQSQVSVCGPNGCPPQVQNWGALNQSVQPRIVYYTQRTYGSIGTQQSFGSVGNQQGFGSQGTPQNFGSMGNRQSSSCNCPNCQQQQGFNARSAGRFSRSTNNFSRGESDQQHLLGHGWSFDQIEYADNRTLQMMHDISHGDIPANGLYPQGVKQAGYEQRGYFNTGERRRFQPIIRSVNYRERGGYGIAGNRTRAIFPNAPWHACNYQR